MFALIALDWMLSMAQVKRCYSGSRSTREDARSLSLTHNSFAVPRFSSRRASASTSHSRQALHVYRSTQPPLSVGDVRPDLVRSRAFDTVPVHCFDDIEARAPRLNLVIHESVLIARRDADQRVGSA
jgi:hypothetical protein